MINHLIGIGLSLVGLALFPYLFPSKNLFGYSIFDGLLSVLMLLGLILVIIGGLNG